MRGWDTACVSGLLATTLWTVIDLVSKNLDRIRAVCRQRGVAYLDLVGSATRGDFDESRSDVDVVIDFPDGTEDFFGSFMGLREDLAAIFGRRVDVITIRGVRNPYILESLRRDAVRLYAA